jgi:ubiquinone/menaquinone biosynthesis C-methylase UbiE
MRYSLPGLAASNAVAIAETLKSISGGRVLDVATGDGDFVSLLIKTLKNYDSFVGVDISAKDVEAARKRLATKPVKILQMNAEALEFGDGSFDTVCISASLHHLDKIDNVLAEMRRVLKTGGYFILQEMYCDGNQTEAQKTEILKHHWHAEIDSLLGITRKINKTLTRQRIIDIANSLKLEELTILESTRYVKCLFCEKRFECEDPKSDELVSESIGQVQDDLKRLANCAVSTRRTHLEEIGERLKKRIARYGSQEASHFLITGRKGR